MGLVLLAFADQAFQAAYLGRPLVRESEQVTVDAEELRRTRAAARRELAVTVRRNVRAALMSVAYPIIAPATAKPAGPVRWKQFLMTALVIWCLQTAVSTALRPLVGDWPAMLRSGVTIIPVVALMT
ncbi:hypothetical protein [Actinoplanes palleronii]|uniref:Uncharacterized protein n=1 Tax=Actinoplanes palleronii TaxID=113570 RepID=A0ABQ4B646_9ACTN|nr:hypothetical protein [Actinoplanes palleronii]GIE66113.1 hypothetical protein Apa02nite_022210 [Actinoplanes palleronii]